jgi:hypothetical protein
MSRPRDPKGELITFAVQYDRQRKISQYLLMRAQQSDSVAKICGRRGQPELAGDVCQLNGIRSPHVRLQAGRQLRLPGIMDTRLVVNVLADDPPPIIKDGYAQYDTVAVPARVGITRFLGYNPYQMDVPVQWDDFKRKHHPDAGVDCETDIWRLEMMAGRGSFQGAAEGPPAIIRVGCTDDYGHVVPLIPRNLQWMPGSYAPLWRITGFAWDANPIRVGRGQPGHGRRVRQKAVVSLQEFREFTVAQWTRSASGRAKKGKAKK